MKYIGSKNKLKKHIVPLLNSIIRTNNIIDYCEPFVGGANVIDDIICENKLGNDKDLYLISLLTKAKEDVAIFNTLPELPSREHYYDVRDNKDKYENWYIGAILFFGSYNARAYGGCYGVFAKTKDGKIRNYFQEAKRNLTKQSVKFKNVLFSNKDYKDLHIKPKTLIYCDPPYSEGIGYLEQFNKNEFWDWVREKSIDNIVIISEYEAPYDFECIFEQEVTTHQNNRNKHKRTEKLFIHKKLIKIIKGELKDEIL